MADLLKKNFQLFFGSGFQPPGSSDKKMRETNKKMKNSTDFIVKGNYNMKTSMRDKRESARTKGIPRTSDVTT